MNYCVHIVVAWTAQDFQAISNRIEKSTSALGVFSCLLSYFQINIQVNSIIHFKLLSCICIMPGISPFLCLARIMLHFRPFFAQNLCYHLFESRYPLFSVLGRFSFSSSISDFWMENL